MRIASRLKAPDPGRFLIDLGTDRGFFTAREVWTKPEWRGQRAALSRAARVLQAEHARKGRAIQMFRARRHFYLDEFVESMRRFMS